MIEAPRLADIWLLWVFCSCSPICFPVYDPVCLRKGMRISCVTAVLTGSRNSRTSWKYFQFSKESLKQLQSLTWSQILSPGSSFQCFVSGHCSSNLCSVDEPRKYLSHGYNLEWKFYNAQQTRNPLEDTVVLSNHSFQRFFSLLSWDFQILQAGS